MLESIYYVINDERERAKFAEEIKVAAVLFAAAYGTIIGLALAVTKGWL